MGASEAFGDPSGVEYVISANNPSISSPVGWIHPGWSWYVDSPSYGYNIVFVFMGHRCNNATNISTTGTNNYTILYGLEPGGPACSDG